MADLETIELNLKDKIQFWSYKEGFDYKSLENKLKDLKINSSDPNIWTRSDAKIFFNKLKISKTD